MYGVHDLSIAAWEIVLCLLFVETLVAVAAYYEGRIRRERRKAKAREEEWGRRLNYAVWESQENERKRLAADLHDGVGALLSGLRLNMITLARQRKALAEPLDALRSLLEAAVDAVRNVSHGMMPVTLDRFGLRAALHELCDQLRGCAAIPLVFDETGDPIRLEKSREVLIYRTVQELLQNALKYGNAGVIRLHMKWSDGLTVVVSDSGGDAVAPRADRKTGIGLYNVENRARLLGGKVNYQKVAPRGTKVELLIPV